MGERMVQSGVLLHSFPLNGTSSNRSYAVGSNSRAEDSMLFHTTLHNVLWRNRPHRVTHVKEQALRGRFQTRQLPGGTIRFAAGRAEWGQILVIKNAQRAFFMTKNRDVPRCRRRNRALSGSNARFVDPPRTSCQGATVLLYNALK